MSSFPTLIDPSQSTWIRSPHPVPQQALPLFDLNNPNISRSLKKPQVCISELAGLHLPLRGPARSSMIKRHKRLRYQQSNGWSSVIMLKMDTCTQVNLLAL